MALLCIGSSLAGQKPYLAAYYRLSGACYSVPPNHRAELRDPFDLIHLGAVRVK